MKKFTVNVAGMEFYSARLLTQLIDTLMTEREFLQQLFLLRQDISSLKMMSTFDNQQRERWAARLGDLLNRRNASHESETSRVRELEVAIRSHRDARGDDRCWIDDEELYKVLPEGYTPPERDTLVELSACERFILNRRNPDIIYISPQQRIEELEAENRKLKGE